MLIFIQPGANSVLIMEDDCAFINNIQYINYHLNKYPKDADIVNFGYFMCSDVSQEELNSKKDALVKSSQKEAELYEKNNAKVLVKK